MKRLIRFGISGACGLTVNLGIFQLSYVLGVPYLISSIAGLSGSTGVGFVLQKYWTFGDRTQGATHWQFAGYVAVMLMNLVLNTWLVYGFVEWLKLYPLFAQALGAGVVALNSFLIYHQLIFKSVAEDVVKAES
ncbi:hypothetical protein COU19_00535 [Candidatus Kaiserbacteria bacterium CG10_big_fil_rev_8_21_14_0_10_56_12]|uniref:GtrA/DPMS transmembrane domain-containing protein n=1 Tax=Candidatus Kaiserbacteria bacterium CG10_big_fil_rev_8_21_14_0_10_56_12 TaxID=1974611 RepID=A0A2H0UAI6_9BACT|nr:MAG: hypothetical protein COU19_00535 [Candidatus Kaiserbacteria bacterium CG10_big_fil_rev_8_21_14_0_10_56_12]